MIDIKYTCHFLLDKEDGKVDAKLRCRVKWDHNKNIVSFYPGYRVDVDKWVPEAQRCRNNTTHGKARVTAAVINRAIQRYSDVVAGVFADFGAEGREPTKAELKERVGIGLGKTPREEEGTLLDRFDEFVAEMSVRNEWTEGTLRKMASLRGHLAKFRPRLGFKDLDEPGLEAYLNFVTRDLGLRNSTAAKDLSDLKWFLRWAKRKGYTSTLDFLDFNPKIKQLRKEVVYLDWDELMRVYGYVVPPDGTEVTLTDHDGRKYVKVVRKGASLEKVRDVFCFCCFTSLRYSDVASLRTADIYDDHISVVSRKSLDTLDIELNAYSKAILERHKGASYGRGLALPVMSNQKMNERLKTLCELCEINRPVRETYYKEGERVEEIHPKYELIGTHTARRTFIVHALMMGTPANVVMEWTGHDSYEAMRPYVAVANEAKTRYMSRFDSYGEDTKKADKD